MDKIPSEVIDQINHLLGIQGKPYRRFANGEWVDTDCYQWHQPRALEWPEPPLELPSDLKEAMERISKIAGSEMPSSEEFDIDSYSARIRELFEEENDEVKASLESISPELVELVDYPLRKRKQWRSRLEAVRKLLEESPYVAYGDVIVAPTNDQFNILRIEETNGNNYEIDTEDIISALRTIHDEHGATILTAGFDNVSFEIERPPIGDQATLLGKSLIQLCPDLFEPPKEFPEGIVALWWD